jgi:hypothetical protein
MLLYMVLQTLQVPFRRVHLTNGNHFDLYDTSGPQVKECFMVVHRCLCAVCCAWSTNSLD